mgnify:CR=1 FL=1
MDTAAIGARLLAAVPAFAGRIGTALQLAELMKRSQLPVTTPAAFLLPLGLRGGRGEAATGKFIQGLDRFLGVVLVVRSASDPLGAKVADELIDLIEAVVPAIVGWAPASAIGVFRLARGELLSLAGGAVTYQLDFILDDQLRVNT